MKKWSIYLLKTMAEFFWFCLVYIAKALKWVGMKAWTTLFKKKEKPKFDTAAESKKLQMDAIKKRPEYMKQLIKVESEMADHSDKFKSLYVEQQRLLQMINIADGGLEQPVKSNGNRNNNNQNNNNQKQKGGNNNGNNKPAIASFQPTLAT